jgi:hypothetical protein
MPGNSLERGLSRVKTYNLGLGYRIDHLSRAFIFCDSSYFFAIIVLWILHHMEKIYATTVLRICTIGRGILVFD